MKEKLKKAYEAGQKSVIGKIDDGYSIDVDKRQTFDSWYNSEFKNCSIPAVINRRELLVAFLREYHTSMLVFAEIPDIETIVDDYLKSN